MDLVFPTNRNAMDHVSEYFLQLKFQFAPMLYL